MERTSLHSPGIENAGVNDESIREDRLGEGERVSLWRLRARDEDELLELRRASWDFLRPWEPPPAEGVDPVGPSWFRLLLDGARRPDTERLLVRRTADHRVLGLFSLSQIFRGPLESAYVGYWVGQEFAGHGYMTEAFRLVLDFAFHDLRLHRLEANIRPDNPASLALARRLGFRREGYSPRYLRIDGEWRDHERWAILADEWPGPPAD